MSRRGFHPVSGCRNTRERAPPPGEDDRSSVERKERRTQSIEPVVYRLREASLLVRLAGANLDLHIPGRSTARRRLSTDAAAHPRRVMPVTASAGLWATKKSPPVARASSASGLERAAGLAARPPHSRRHPRRMVHGHVDRARDPRHFLRRVGAPVVGAVGKNDDGVVVGARSVTMADAPAMAS